jgi:hypothetical protein
MARHPERVVVTGGATIEAMIGDMRVRLETTGLEGGAKSYLKVRLETDDTVQAETAANEPPLTSGGGCFGEPRSIEIQFLGDEEIVGAVQSFEVIADLIRRSLRLAPEFRAGPLQSLSVRNDGKTLVIGANLKRHPKKATPG